jgi:type I restriction enzyme S subunit
MKGRVTLAYPSNYHNSLNFRTYIRKDAVVFSKTKEKYGGLSNMAAGFPLEVNGLSILTSEALYQACRFPQMPDIQRIIIRQRSPMTAKMAGKPYRRQTRADWQRVKVKIMRWCLQVKLAQNWIKFSQILLDTGDRPIVEESFKDDFWGAKPEGQTLIGTNALGRLLMELREKIKQSDVNSMFVVEPLTIPNFLLNGQAISSIFVVNKITGTTDAPQFIIGSHRSDEILKAVPQINKMFLFDNQDAIEPRKTIQSIANELKPYDSYKESGIPWLGKVPMHWEVLPLRRLLVERKERNDPIKTNNILSLSMEAGVIPYADKKPGGNKAKEDLSAYMLAYPGDIVLNSMNVIVGSVGLSKYFGAVSPVYYMLHPYHVSDSVEFFSAIFQDKSFQHSLFGLGNGILIIQSKSSGKFNTIRMRIPMEKLKLVSIPHPSIEEQTAIVKYLNYMDHRIRHYISVKKKLIILLNQQKQAIIHQAVTRGLDPNVKLKPSGVERLGEIPEHWEVRRLKNICRFEYGDSLPDILRSSGNIAVFGSNGQVGCHTIANTYAPCIIIGRKGSFGKVNFCREPVFSIDTTFFVDNRFTSANLLWLYYILNWLKLDEISKDSAVPGLDREDAYRRLVALPGLNEQKEISNFIENSISVINQSIVTAQKGVNLISEFHTRLIADVVTGKLDVRDIAASLPDEIEENNDDTETELSADSDLMEEENMSASETDEE